MPLYLLKFKNRERIMLKLVMARKLSYYFCGNIALNISNTENNPVVVDINDLTDQECVGLNRAVKTKVIFAIEGAEALEERCKKITEETKLKLDRFRSIPTPKEIVIEKVEEIQIIEEATVEESKDLKEEESTEDIQDLPKEELEIKELPKDVEEIKELETDLVNLGTKKRGNKK